MIKDYKIIMARKKTDKKKTEDKSKKKPTAKKSTKKKTTKKSAKDTKDKKTSKKKTSKKETKEEPKKKKRNPWAKKKGSKKRSGDKIFGNDYNQGNIEHESFSELKIDSDFAGTYLDNCYDSEEYVQRKEMDEKIYDLFSESRWSNFSIRKKFPKDHLPHIFNYLRKGLDGQGYTSSDMFIAISDFLDVKYAKLYDLIGVKHKEEILVELEKKYNVLSDKKEKRLF